MNFPRVSCYSQHASLGYGTNAMRVTFMGVTVWLSYQTPVAFRFGDNPVVVRCNSWGNTTGKHLNAIDGGNHAARVSPEEFERLWNEQVSRFLKGAKDDVAGSD